MSQHCMNSFLEQNQSLLSPPQCDLGVCFECLTLLLINSLQMFSFFLVGSKKFSKQIPNCDE